MDQQSEDLMNPCCAQDESQSEPGQLDPTLLWLRDTFILAMFHVRQRLLWAAVILSAAFLLLWTATFLYSAFYYSYMPNPAYATPVHYYYRTDCESLDSHLCSESNPVANISLLLNGKSQVMTFGQPYRISLVLEMPDSPTNRELGMFMIRMTFYSRQGKEVASSAHSASLLLSASSSRFTMLRYRSSLLRSIGTLLFLPAYLTGVAEQKQLLEVEIFSDYTDRSYAFSVGAFIEILSSKVQIYSSQLFIYAHFSGIRYILHNFPLTSAIIGVASNFMFLSALLLLGSLREGTWTSQQNKTREHSLKKKRRTCKDQEEDHEDSTAEMNALEDSSVDLLHIRPTDLSQGEPCM